MSDETITRRKTTAPGLNGNGSMAKEIAGERTAVSSARDTILKQFGDKTPSELFSTAIASIKNDTEEARVLISNISDKMIKHLTTIRNAIKMLEFDIDRMPLKVKIGTGLAQAFGVVKLLKTQYESAVAAVNDYLAYWTFVKQNSRLPPWYKFALSKYNGRKISYVINSIFVAEEKITRQMFSGLDFLYKSRK